MKLCEVYVWLDLIIQDIKKDLDMDEKVIALEMTKLLIREKVTCISDDRVKTK